MKIKNYLVIIILWIISILVIVLTWGSGRLFIIFPTFITTIGYYLVVKAIEGKRNAKNINIDDLGNIKTGLSRIKGSIKPVEDFYSIINNEKVVFYDVVVEKGEATYSEFDSSKKNTNVDTYNKQMVKVKWKLIARDSKWIAFYVKDETGKIIVENPEYGEGDWIFNKNQINEVKIETFKDAPDKIKEIVNQSLKTSNKKIEEGRTIRYLERTIKPDDDVIVYGTIEKTSKNNDCKYSISKGKDGVFFITNDKNFDLENFEHKNYLKGLILLILGFIGMLIAFLWPYILKATDKL